ncbi:hypothetical protein GE061_011969 [Apolygus lucorum]|uniref:G-protein coupled receptors family 1 profile domain-containing protein n=1 Tax=Apolygus lucorum TaxID=248454 RepID=A0A8S9XR90_APOLU|nr:hypothetical protein GE061_011969 [Apolygus lucorum]
MSVGKIVDYWDFHWTSWALFIVATFVAIAVAVAVAIVVAIVVAIDLVPQRLVPEVSSLPGVSMSCGEDRVECGDGMLIWCGDDHIGCGDDHGDIGIRVSIGCGDDRVWCGDDHIWCGDNHPWSFDFINESFSGNLTDSLGSEFRYSFPVTVFFCIAYTSVFLIGVTGNCFVVSVVYRSPRMRSPTNLFIVNLACADLLVNVICLPFTLVQNVTTAWTMGWLVCKTIPYLQGVSVNASINTLVAISAERCLAICYPMKLHVTSRVVRWVVFVIWTVSLSITLPWALYFQLKPLKQGSQALLCLEAWPTPHSENVYFVVANLVMCYLLPLILISICYLLIWQKVCKRSLPGEQHAHGEQVIQRSKMKVIKMLMVVIVLFACSWLPLYTIITRIKLGGQLSPSEEYFVHSLLPMAQWLGVSNSCINPILYAFFNRKFRAGFKAILSSRSCCSTLRYDYSAQMTLNNSLGANVTRKPPVNRMTISSGVPITKPKRLDLTMRSMSLRTPTAMTQNNNFLMGQDDFKINNIQNAASHDGTFV